MMEIKLNLYGVSSFFRERFPLPALNNKTILICTIAFAILTFSIAALSYHLKKCVRQIKKSVPQKTNLPIKIGICKEGGWFEGKIIYADGKVEEGLFKDSALNGNGKVTFVSGIVDMGHFEDGWLNGKGTVLYPNANTNNGIQSETGDFQSDKLHGRGERTYFNGKKLKGRFHMGTFIPPTECIV